MKFSLDKVVELVSLPKRTVRYYIQKGLVDRPIGERKAAHYTQQHVEQLLAVKRWKQSGLNLERISQLLSGESPAPNLMTGVQKLGSTKVVSRMHIIDGITLEIDAEQNPLNNEQVQTLVHRLNEVLTDIKAQQK
ncbi:MerR family transcriptional regulator [Planctobacterium marinum]|uniref:HTH merR-type domain-containing protein n=1 Tax=Planctobacterium marinum TaxID=1631968 RepID=A0AA48KUE4_9ALTE|nr:hypothetical protein MACH26_18860 [Planctobacterium marinum]